MNSILVPVDLSDNSRNAFRYAVQLAKDTQFTEITVLHVFQLKFRQGFQPIDKLAALESEAMSAAKQELQQFLALDEDLTQGLHIHQVLRVGFAIEEILSVAEHNGYDLIIMGTKGATNLQEKLLGSNTATVIDNTNIPVLAVPGHSVYEPVRRILHLVDLERVHLPALARLLAIVRKINCELEFLQYNADTAQMTPEHQEQYRQQVLSALAYSRLTVRFLASDVMEQELPKVSADEPIEVLCVGGAHERSLQKRLFGKNVARHMAQHIQYPLLSVQV